MSRPRLPRLLDRIARGRPRPAAPRGVRTAFEHVLWENVAYLADEERRAAAFAALRARIGTAAHDVAAAEEDELVAVAALGGIFAEKRARRVQQSARLVLAELGGDLDAVLAWPRDHALRALQRFPGIGRPGAEKILLFAGAEPILALDSNGLRVLVRLGYGEESRSYERTYREAQAAASAELPATAAARQRAHLLLRAHGRETCKRTRPACGACPVAADCPAAAAG